MVGEYYRRRGFCLAVDSVYIARTTVMLVITSKQHFRSIFNIFAQIIEERPMLFIPFNECAIEHNTHTTLLSFNMYGYWLIKLYTYPFSMTRSHHSASYVIQSCKIPMTIQCIRRRCAICSITSTDYIFNLSKSVFQPYQISSKQKNIAAKLYSIEFLV